MDSASATGMHASKNSNHTEATQPSAKKIKQLIAIEDNGQQSLPYVYSQLRKAKATLLETKQKASTIRNTHLSDLATYYVTIQKSPTHIQALKRIVNAENHRDVFRKIKHGLSRLEVPSTSITLPDNLSPNANLETYPATSNEWIPVTKKEHIEDHLLQRNATHFRQANNTPFGNTPRGTELGYQGTSHSADAILEGRYTSDTTNELTPEAQAYLQELQYMPDVHAGNTVNITLTTTDVQQTFSNWRETTSTSPSG